MSGCSLPIVLSVCALASTATAQDVLTTPIPDSPDFHTYSYDTLAELGWIEIDISERRGISGWTLDYTWETLDDFMGTFYAYSPSGTVYVIGFSEAAGAYQKSTAVFNDEWSDGTWLFRVEDVQGFGEQQALDLVWTLEFHDADVPFGMRAVTSGNTALLDWNGAAADAGLAGYRIYREGAPIADVPAAVTTYSDSGLAPGFFCYYVTALYDTIESAPSNEACTTIYSPGIYGLADGPDEMFRYNSYYDLGWTDMDVIDRGLAENWSITFTWENVNGYFEGSLHAESPDGTLHTIGSDFADGLHTIDVAAFDGESVYGPWRVWIEDDDVYGDGFYRVSDAVVTIDVNRRVPTELTAVTVGDDIELNWIAPQNADGLTGYVVYRDDYDPAPYDTVDASVTTYLDTGVVPGSLYCYRVAAAHGAEEETWPKQACAGAPGVYSIPDSPPPNQPNTYYYDSFDEAGWYEFEINDRGVVRDWRLSFDWTTNMPAEGRLYARSPADEQIAVLSGSPSGFYEAYTDEFNDSPAHGRWRIWIVDNDFFGDGMHRAEDIVLYIDIDRTAPVDLAADAEGPVVRLSWVEPQESEGLTGYNIYRNDAGATPIAVAAPGATSWIDSNVVAGTTYCYQISATYDGGESSWPQQACAGTRGAFPIPDAPPMNHYGEPDNYWCNSFTESGWTEIDVTDIGVVGEWYIDFNWTTNWAAEGRFYAMSPSGVQFTIINGDPSGVYRIESEAFDGEPADGLWRLWIVDNDFFCDGSHRATDITMYVIPRINGDLDGDSDVDLSDLAALLAHYGVASGAEYSDGDLDNDGDVDLSDLAALLANYGFGG